MKMTKTKRDAIMILDVIASRGGNYQTTHRVAELIGFYPGDPAVKIARRMRIYVLNRVGFHVSWRHNAACAAQLLREGWEPEA